MKFIDFEKLAALFLKYWDKFLIDGVSYTLALAAITVAFGAVFASVLALMKMSKIPPLRWLSTIYIEIIRGTELEAEVVPNLMVGFGIDQIQAEYVAEIKLRNINREYILRRTAETEELEKDIADLEDVLQSRRRVRNIIIDELKAINKKYPVPRRSSIVYASEVESDDEEEQVEDYPVTLFLSREGYFKKITQQSLRMSGEQKYKDGDSLRISLESSNRCDLLIFTDRQQIYKLRLADMEETKASALGVYLPSRLQMDDGDRKSVV